MAVNPTSVNRGWAILHGAEIAELGANREAMLIVSCDTGTVPPSTITDGNAAASCLRLDPGANIRIAWALYTRRPGSLIVSSMVIGTGLYLLGDNKDAGGIGTNNVLFHALQRQVATSFPAGATWVLQASGTDVLINPVSITEFSGTTRMLPVLWNLASNPDTNTNDTGPKTSGVTTGNNSFYVDADGYVATSTGLGADPVLDTRQLGRDGVVRSTINISRTGNSGGVDCKFRFSNDLFRQTYPKNPSIKYNFGGSKLPKNDATLAREITVVVTDVNDAVKHTVNVTASSFNTGEADAGVCNIDTRFLPVASNDPLVHTAPSAQYRISITMDHTSSCPANQQSNVARLNTRSSGYGNDLAWLAFPDFGDNSVSNIAVGEQTIVSGALTSSRVRSRGVANDLSYNNRSLYVTVPGSVTTSGNLFAIVPYASTRSVVGGLFPLDTVGSVFNIGSGSWSLECRIKVPAAASNTFGANILLFRVGFSTGIGYQKDAGGQVTLVGIYRNGGTGGFVTTPVSVNSDQEYHVLLVRSLTINFAYLYLNGVLSTQLDITGGTIGGETGIIALGEQTNGAGNATQFVGQAKAYTTSPYSGSLTGQGILTDLNAIQPRTNLYCSYGNTITPTFDIDPRIKLSSSKIYTDFTYATESLSKTVFRRADIVGTESLVLDYNDNKLDNISVVFGVSGDATTTLNTGTGGTLGRVRHNHTVANTHSAFNRFKKSALDVPSSIVEDGLDLVRGIRRIFTPDFASNVPAGGTSVTFLSAPTDPLYAGASIVFVNAVSGGVEELAVVKNVESSTTITLAAGVTNAWPAATSRIYLRVPLYRKYLKATGNAFAGANEPFTANISAFGTNSEIIFEDMWTGNAAEAVIITDGEPSGVPSRTKNIGTGELRFKLASKLAATGAGVRITGRHNPRTTAGAIIPVTGVTLAQAVAIYDQTSLAIENAGASAAATLNKSTGYGDTPNNGFESKDAAGNARTLDLILGAADTTGQRSTLLLTGNPGTAQWTIQRDPSANLGFTGDTGNYGYFIQRVSFVVVDPDLFIAACPSNSIPKPGSAVTITAKFGKFLPDNSTAVALCDGDPYIYIFRVVGLSELVLVASDVMTVINPDGNGKSADWRYTYTPTVVAAYAVVVTGTSSGSRPPGPGKCQFRATKLKTFDGVDFATGFPSTVSP